MQLMMTKAAYQRVSARLPAAARDLDIVLVAGPESFERPDGRVLEGEAVDPTLIWSSLDAYPAGLLGALFSRVLKASSPQWMQTFNAGLDLPVFRQVMEKGVRICKSDAQATPIAEYVVAHAVSLIVPIERQAQLQAERKWALTPYREISQTRWTLVGYGAIGRRIAERIKPFGAHLTVVRRPGGDQGLADAAVSQADLPAVLPDSDVVVLACALNDETRGIANAAFFAAMKPGAILINIGRGGLVDEEALRAGLDRDQPGRAVLDVFQTEPLAEDSWLWTHPKVRVTAHTSNSGQGTLSRGDELFLENLRRYLAGEAVLNEASRGEVGL